MMDTTMQKKDTHAAVNPFKYLLKWIIEAVRWQKFLLFFFLQLDKEHLAHFEMFGVRLKSKPRKQSRGFVGGRSGPVSKVDDHVVMLCEDVPSEGSSMDSGRGCHSSAGL